MADEIVDQIKGGFSSGMKFGPSSRSVSKNVSDKEAAIQQKTSEVETSVKNTLGKSTNYLKRSANGLPSLGASAAKQAPPKTARRKGVRKPG